MGYGSARLQYIAFAMYGARRVTFDATQRRTIMGFYELSRAIFLAASREVRVMRPRKRCGRVARVWSR